MLSKVAPWLLISIPACGHWKSCEAVYTLCPAILPHLVTCLWNLPVGKSLPHTIFFSEGTSALIVALNFCNTPAASTKEARAQESDTLPRLSLCFPLSPHPQVARGRLFSYFPVSFLPSTIWLQASQCSCKRSIFSTWREKFYDLSISWLDILTHM